MQDDSFLKKLLKNDIVVCDDEYISLIENSINNGFVQFKILNYCDFIKNILGEIDDNVQVELIKNGYNPYFAEKLITNYFLEKFLGLNDKRYLNTKNIIEKYHQVDKIMANYLLEKQVYFLNPDYTNNIINLILKLYPKIITKEISTKNLENVKLYKCTTIEEEVNNLTNLITEELLLEQNEIINIYIPDNEYIPYIIRNFDLLHLNYNLDNKMNLYDLEFVKRLIDLLDLEQEFNVDLINKYLDTISMSKDTTKFISVINSFIKYDPAYYPYFRSMFVKKLKNTSCESNTKTSIVLHTIFPKVVDNEKYYMVGFNQNKIIKCLTDDDFISDKVKAKYGLKISKDKNNYLKNNFIMQILSLNELTISYNLSNHQIPSLILEELKEKVNFIEYEPKLLNKTQREYILYQTAKYLDEFEKYQKIHPLLKEIYEEKSLDEYLTYDNTFNGNFIIPNQINLSYTTIDIYNKCRYQYYLKYILNIKDNDSKDNILIGNYFHNLLKSIQTKEVELKELNYLTNKYLEENDLNNQAIKQYYYQKYENLLLKVLEYIKLYDSRTMYDEIYYEREIVKNIDNDLITGRIDKMFVKKQNDISKIIVIDYKTGNTIIDLPLIKYGLSLQIPFYFYLLTDSSKMEIIAGYIQKVMPSKVFEYKDGKSYEDNFKEEYKYNGLTVSTPENLAIIDANYLQEESSISGLKLKSDGTFYKSFVDKGLSKEEIVIIKKIVEENIKDVLNNIHQGDFKIDPKIVDNKTTCNYCKFFSICNRKYQDFVHLKKDKDLTFLRGDNNDTN